MCLFCHGLNLFMRASFRLSTSRLGVVRLVPLATWSRDKIPSHEEDKAGKEFSLGHLSEKEKVFIHETARESSSVQRKGKKKP